MSETQGYKISHETMAAALFALRARVIHIEMMKPASELAIADYWNLELAKAKAAIAELEALNA